MPSFSRVVRHSARATRNLRAAYGPSHTSIEPYFAPRRNKSSTGQSAGSTPAKVTRQVVQEAIDPHASKTFAIMSSGRSNYVPPSTRGTLRGQDAEQGSTPLYYLRGGSALIQTSETWHATLSSFQYRRHCANLPNHRNNHPPFQVPPPNPSYAIPSTSYTPPTPSTRRKAIKTYKAEQRDKITPPSAESGGVPNPTLEYMQLASHPPFRLPNPRSILVVVDLNGTLLHRPSRKNPTNFVQRPHAAPFLSYCINTFTVAIWSSARPDNVRIMCKQLLSADDRAKVVAVWGREKFGLSNADYNMRVQCYKRLTSLWNDPAVMASHPRASAGERWDQTNTVLVDDSLEKARSEPHNILALPEFTGSSNEPGYILPQVHDYLNECSQQANISAYMRSSPFKVDPDFALRQDR